MANVRSNESWLQDLAQPGPARETALAELRRVLLRGLPYALASWLPSSDPQFDSFVDEVIQDTLVRVLDRLDSFEGRSRFTTWVQKIAVRIALSELRRKRWRDVSLDGLLEVSGESGLGLMTDPAPGPEAAVERSDVMARVWRIVEEELTDKQRAMLVATRLHGMPLEEAARRMDTNRNALYKLLHDARRRLKKRLGAEGLSVADVLAAFED